MANKSSKDDTLKLETRTYTVVLDQDTVVSVDATSAEEAVNKAKKEAK